MNNIEQQHHCSSKPIVNNISIFSKLRQSVLIIDIEPIVDKNQQSNDQAFESIVNDYTLYYYSRKKDVLNELFINIKNQKKMNSSKFLTDTDDLSDVIVTLNITETNITMNGSKPKTFMKTPNHDTSINNIILGIGAVVVILIVILIIIKLIYKCYQLYKSDDDEDEIKEAVKKSPLLPSTSPNMIRRKSSIRDPLAPIHRSSLNLETQMEIRQKRLSQTYSNTPPSIKKP